MSKTPTAKRTAIVAGILLAAAAVAFVSRDQWLPNLGLFAEQADQLVKPSDDDPHSEHDHGHEGHSEAASIELSERGLKNIGFEPLMIELKDYVRSLTLPAIIVERPSRSQVHIAAPLTGIVTRVYAVEGEAIGPDEPLFDLRLTYEELVTAQTDFVQTLAQLDIANRELERLQGLGNGVIAGKRILEQQYEQQKLEASLMASEQAMLLHGLTQPQIDNIRQTKQLFRQVTVRTPPHTHTEESCQGPHLFTIQRLEIAKGEQAEVGGELAVLADHCELHVEAIAFEDDADAIRSAANANRNVTARLVKANSQTEAIKGLEVLYVADQIDPTSRALKVYLRLSNVVALERTRPDGKRFLEWKYKPGQRLEISIPVETWEDQLVVSTTAVVDEGAESYVYRQNGDHFDQVSVHVVHREQNAIVIANDGALFPGDVIAGNGAYQMHLALKNKSGGGVDPHAGHNH